MAHLNDQISAVELHIILRELKACLKNTNEGDIVELGCYKGFTSLELQRTAEMVAPNRQLFVYDSFAGLPPKAQKDSSPMGTQFMPGELPASKKEVIRLFKQANTTMPYIKKAWFSDLGPADMPDKIAFAFLDGDFYESVKDSLRLVWPRLVPGAVIIVDDYQNAALPGAQKAVDEWLANHRCHFRIEASLVIMKYV